MGSGLVGLYERLTGESLLGISQLWEAHFCRIKAPNAKLETVDNTGA